MTDFSREAAKLLRATEDALYHRKPVMRLSEWDGGDTKFRGGSSDCGDVRRGPQGDPRLPFEAVWYTDSNGGNCCGSAGYVTELHRQMRVLMTEVSELRSELAAERDSRSTTLTALGRRWREEVLLEVRASEHQSRRAIDELSVAVQQQRKDDEVARSLLQQRVEDLLRDSKVRDRTQFDIQEQLREQLDTMRDRLESAVSECSQLRIQCVQHQERENSAIVQRLDAELMRYVDMRADEQRERQQLKLQLKAEVEAFGAHVQELVDKTWRTHLATTRRELQDPIDAVVKQMAQHTEGMTDLSAKVHDCTTTCRAELKLHTATLQERVSAAEANAAVMLSRLDRAERKADGAQEAASRADATIAVVRDVAERAVVVSQRAMATAQRAEDAMEDRDARVAQLETHLTAVSTAEKLRADLESVRRSAQRAENGVDALRHVYERDVQEQESEKRQLDGLMERVSVCERSQQHLRTSLEGIADNRIPQLQQRLVVLEEAREILAVEANRGENALLQNQQHILSIEGNVRSLSERLEQLRRDMNVSSQSLSTRVEAANDAALRCETSSATARCEVERIERRISQLEMQSTRLTADLTTLQSTAEDNAKGTQVLSAQLQQQQRLWQEQRESRRELEAAAAATNEAEIVAEQMSGRLEIKFNQQMRRVESNMAERAEKLEARIEETSSRLDQLQDKGQATSSRVTQVGEAVQQQQQQLARDLQACRAKIDVLNTTVTAMDEASEQRFKDCVLQQDLNILRRAVKALEAELRKVGADLVQHQQWTQSQEEYEIKVKNLEDEQRRQQAHLREVKKSINEFFGELKDAQHFAATPSQSVAAGERGNVRRGDDWPTQGPPVEKLLFESHQATSSNEARGSVPATPMVGESNVGESLVTGSTTNILGGASTQRRDSDAVQPADSPEPQNPPRQPHSADNSLISQTKRILSPPLPVTVEPLGKVEPSGQTGSTVPDDTGERKPPSTLSEKTIAEHQVQPAPSRKVISSSSDSTVNTLEVSIPIDKRGHTMFAPRESSSSSSSAGAQQQQQKGVKSPRVSDQTAASTEIVISSGHKGSDDSVTHKRPSLDKTATPPSSSREVLVSKPASKTPDQDPPPLPQTEKRVDVEPTKVQTTNQYDDWDDDTASDPAASVAEQTSAQALEVEEKEEEAHKDTEKIKEENSAEDLSAGTREVSNPCFEADTDVVLGSRMGRYSGGRSPHQAVEELGDDFTFTVPRHGVSTTSNTSSRKSKDDQSGKQPAVKQFTSFDDSSSEEDA